MRCLILHESDQWRNDERQTVLHYGWQLIAEGFAGSGRKHAEEIAARQQRRNGALLPGTKFLGAERAVQNLQTSCTQLSVHGGFSPFPVGSLFTSIPRRQAMCKCAKLAGSVYTLSIYNRAKIM